MRWQAEVWYHWDDECVRGEGALFRGTTDVIMEKLEEMGPDIRLAELTPLEG